MPVITKEDVPFEIGKGVLLADGADITLVACGQMVYESLQARELLLKEGINARVINLHTPRPIDEEILVKTARENPL